MGDVKFIRKNGRIIPIRKNKPTGHALQAKAGVLQGVGIRLAQESNKKAAIFGGVLAGTAGIYSGVKQITDAYRHGKETKSGLSGLARFVTLGWANAAGTVVGAKGSHYALKGASTGAKKLASRVRKVK